MASFVHAPERTLAQLLQELEQILGATAGGIHRRARRGVPMPTIGGESSSVTSPMWNTPLARRTHDDPTALCVATAKSARVEVWIGDGDFLESGLVRAYVHTTYSATVRT